MAYESETNKVLAGKARAGLNVAENNLQAAMRRLDELDRRYAVGAAPAAPPVAAVPPAPIAVPPPVEAPVAPPPPFLEPSGWVKASSIQAVPRNFDVNTFLRPAAPGYKVPIGELSAMRISQPHVAISRVDPFFRVASGDHTHDLFNRSNIPASGEYDDLIASNNAQGEGGLINASFYALGSLVVQDMDDRWHNLIARYSIFYYKHDRAENPMFKNPMLKRADIPRGMKMLGGIRHYREPADWRKVSSNPMSNSPASYRILQGQFSNPASVEGATEYSWKLDALLPFAKPGRHVQVNLEFPRFWDGQHVDSPNHVDHVQYWYSESHCHVLPTLSTHAVYTLPDFPIKRIATSADIKADGTLKGEAGRETHGYWWEGFVDEIRETIHRSVFDTGMDGSNGNLQNGNALSWPPARPEKPLSILVTGDQDVII